MFGSPLSYFFSRTLFLALIIQKTTRWILMLQPVCVLTCSINVHHSVVSYLEYSNIQHYLYLKHTSVAIYVHFLYLFSRKAPGSSRELIHRDREKSVIRPHALSPSHLERIHLVSIERVLFIVTCYDQPVLQLIRIFYRWHCRWRCHVTEGPVLVHGDGWSRSQLRSNDRRGTGRIAQF